MDEQVLFAAFGALAGQLLGLVELKNVPPSRRPNLRDVWYWAPFVVSPILGAGLAFAYLRANIPMNSLLAVHVGIAAPLVLRSMAEVRPPEPGPIDPSRVS